MLPGYRGCVVALPLLLQWVCSHDGVLILRTPDLLARDVNASRRLSPEADFAVRRLHLLTDVINR